MSSRELEARNEHIFNQAAAQQLGITVDEFEEIDAELEGSYTEDGILTGYNVTWSSNANLHILQKISNYNNGDSFVRIGPIYIQEL